MTKPKLTPAMRKALEAVERGEVRESGFRFMGAPRQTINRAVRLGLAGWDMTTFGDKLYMLTPKGREALGGGEDGN